MCKEVYVPCLLAVEGCDDMGARLRVSLALRVEHARPHVELVLVVKMAVQRHSPVLHLLQTLQNAAHTHTHTHTEKE